MPRREPHRLREFTLGLLPAPELHERAGARQAQVESPHAERLRAPERGERFLGTVQARQQRAELLVRGSQARVQRERLPVGGLRLGEAVLANEDRPEGAPAARLARACGQQRAALGLCFRATPEPLEAERQPVPRGELPRIELQHAPVRTRGVREPAVTPEESREVEPEIRIVGGELDAAADQLLGGRRIAAAGADQSEQMRRRGVGRLAREHRETGALGLAQFPLVEERTGVRELRCDLGRRGAHGCGAAALDGDRDAEGALRCVAGLRLRECRIGGWIGAP